MRTARGRPAPSLGAPGLCTATLAGVDPASPDDRHLRYWRSNLRLTGALLAVWFVVTFVIGWFARELDFSFFGWPFSFWVAAQGALIVYVAIVWFYARRMEQLDREHGVAEEE
jgi:putative solute:sodium symporter small subunit